MLKAKLIMGAVRVIMALIAVGLGIWYLSSSLGGAAITYTSTSNFLNAVGVQNGDIGNANGCFMCGYFADLDRSIGFCVIITIQKQFFCICVRDFKVQINRLQGMVREHDGMIPVSELSKED